MDASKLEVSVQELHADLDANLDVCCVRRELDGSGRAGKKCRLVDNIGARLGSEANFGSRKIKISS